MNLRTTRLAGVAVAGLLAVSLAACGGHSSSASSSSSAAPAASPSPVAALSNLTGKHTQVFLDPGFLAALKALKLTPSVDGTATLTVEGGKPTLTFPITGGNATYYKPGSVSPYVQAVIDHQGSGLTLTSGATSVSLDNFVVNAGTSMLTGDVMVDHKPYASGVPLFFLDGRTLQPLQVDKASNTAVLYGTQVKITPQAATALDTVFKTKAVTPYFLVGIAKITLAL